MTQANVENIKAIYQLATLTERQDGINWYPAANIIAVKLAARHSISTAQIIGVIAALSPRNRWERNVEDADRLIAAYVAGGLEQAMLTKVCTFTSNKAKAVKILSLKEGYQDMTEVLEILSGPKLREFASCIAGCQTARSMVMPSVSGLPIGLVLRTFPPLASSFAARSRRTIREQPTSSD